MPTYEELIAQGAVPQQESAAPSQKGLTYEELIAQGATPQEDMSLLEKALVPLHYTGDLVRAGIGEMTGTLKDGEGVAALEGRGAPDSAELMKRGGWENTTALSDIAPGMYSDTGNEWLKFKKGGMLDPTARGTVGLAADIATDPLTYLTGGLSKAAANGKGAIGAALKAFNAYLNPIDAIAQSAKKGAIASTVAHLRPTGKDFRQYGRKGLTNIAEEVLDSGAVKAGAKTEGTLARLNDLTSEIGAVKGDIVKNSTAKIDPLDVAVRVEQEVITPLNEVSANKGLVQSLEEKLSDFLEKHKNGSISPSQLEAEKTAIGNSINRTSDKANQAAWKQYERVLKEASESAVTDPAFKASKRAFGNLKNAEKMAKQTAGIHGLMQYGADLGTLMTVKDDLMSGDPQRMARAVAIGALRGVTRKRLASTSATGLNKLSKVLSKPGVQAVGSAGIRRQFNPWEEVDK